MLAHRKMKERVLKKASLFNSSPSPGKPTTPITEMIMGNMMAILPKAEARTRGASLLERVGLTAAGDRRVGTYSGGMRRRLKNLVGIGSKPSRGRNEEMYELVTPFVPDEFGR